MVLSGLAPLFYWADAYYDAKIATEEAYEIFPVKSGLEAQLQKYRDAVRTVESLDIIDMVAAQRISLETQSAMDTLRTFLEVDSLFVMDATGTQLAGSGAVSVGVNYRYRPYFQKAISGNTYVYPGIGRNLPTPRVFFSAPHVSRHTQKPIGIVGLSINMDRMTGLLKTEKQGTTILGLITEDGVVFAASYPALLYKTVLPISQERLKEIRDSRQFGNLSVEPAIISLGNTRVTLNHKDYRVNRDKLQNTNIELFSLHPVEHGSYLLFMGGVGLVYVLVVFLGFYLAQSLIQIKTQQKNLREANALLVASQQALLHQATHDSLTDLLNRRAALERLAVEMARSKRNEAKLAIGMCDIDHFKQVNDNYGHQIGDEVLRRVAELLLAGTREYDVVARIGGEEFLLITPIKAGTDTASIYERLCSRAAEEKINTRAGELTVTLSIGVAYATEESEMDKLLAAADAALYQAKAQGRNCVAYAVTA